MQISRRQFYNTFIQQNKRSKFTLSTYDLPQHGPFTWSTASCKVGLGAKEWLVVPLTEMPRVHQSAALAWEAGIVAFMLHLLLAFLPQLLT